MTSSFDISILLSFTPWSHKIKMFVSAGCFNLYAVKYFTNQDISWAFEKPSRLSSRKFKSLFLLNVKEVVKLWDTLVHRRGTLPFNRPEQLLWALYYMKVYPTWDQMALTTGITEKTLRKWVGVVVEYLANIDDWVCTTATTLLTSNEIIYLNSCMPSSLTTDRLGEQAPP
jgi:hypothetical protein